MMSEEEIKEFLNKYKDCKCDLREYNSCIECENKVKQAIQGLLDLYNKEKEKNKELRNYISKDKIREKLKEIIEIRNKEFDTIGISMRGSAIDVLKELLEEENV